MNNNLVKSRMKEVIHITALENTNYDFMATHVPFKKLKFQTRGSINSVGEILSEEEYFRSNILENRDEHKLVIIQGDNGSGKSHLIRWLYNSYSREIDNNEELIVLISRGENNLKAALKQIVESNLFNRIEDGNEFKKLIDANDTLSDIEINEQFIALLSATVNSDKNEKKILSKKVKRNLHSFLTDEVIRQEMLFVKNGPIERICNKIINTSSSTETNLEPKFYASDFSIEFGSNIMRSMAQGESASSTRAKEMAEIIANDYDNEIKSRMSTYLNQHIDKVIQSIIKVGQNDLVEIFKEIRSSLKQNEIKLALFIEDITSFAGINKELLETLLIDHNTNGDLCRLISFVGITTDYYDSTIPDNIKDRISDRIIISDESLFETKEDVANLIALYINAISQPKDIFIEWHEKGSKLKDLPLASANIDKEWSTVKIDKERVVSIFPFNKVALWNIYQGMNKTEKTPRNLISLVLLNIYTRYLNNSDLFPPSTDDFGNIELPKWHDEIFESLIQRQYDGIDGKRISALIRVWGNCTLNEKVDLENGEKIVGGISESIFKSFRLPMIDGINDHNGIAPTDNETTKVEKTFEEKLVENKGRDISSNEKSRAEKDFRKYRDELEEWKNGKTLTLHKSLREDVCDFFADFINWESENISPLIIKQVLTMSNVSIEGQNVSIGNGFLLKREEETYYFLLGIISWKYIGEKTWDFNNSEEYILKMTQYLNKHKDSIIRLIKYPPDVTEKEWDYERWMILNSYYINAINGNFKRTDLSKEEIYFILMKNEIIEGNNNCSNNWRKLIERTRREEAFIQNQDQLTRYYNLLLGEANPDKTSHFTIDAYKVLKNIDVLIKNNWSLNFDIDNQSYKGQTKQFVPLNLLKKYWIDKLDNLISDETKNVVYLLDGIHDKLGENLEIGDIKHAKLASKRFLEDGLNSVNLNFNQQDFYPLLETSDNSSEIHYSYRQCLELIGKDNIFKLIRISQNVNADLELFNKSLDLLIEKLNQTNRIITEQLKGFGENLVEELDELRGSLNKNISEIKVGIDDLLGVE